MFPRRILPALLVLSAWAAAQDGAALYKQRCAGCHDGAPQARMPSHDELAAKTPDFVFKAMFEGAMTIQAAGLSQDEGRAIARFITGKEFAAASTLPMAGQCTAPAKAMSVGEGDWNGWGVDLGNSHFQPKPGLAAGDIPKLRLKWAFGFPKEPMAWAQPAIAGGRLFIGSVAGTVYSLDAASGCIYWTYAAGAGVRTAISVGKLASGKWAAYFGDIKANAHAVDAETGAPLWKVKIDEHPVARITGAPALYNGRLYVPVSSIEEVSGQAPNYSCCTFRGSVAALDAATGKQIWKGYTVLDPAKAYKTNKNGTQLMGPAGAAVWNSPTIDVKRKLVYASTGNSYTDVDINTSDAILAFDLETGKLVWSSQVQPKDNFIVGCPNAVNCPEEKGPDFDFGTSAVLRTLPNGKQILVAGQKSGTVYGLDPDNKGKILWRTGLGKGSALGGVEWGDAADDALAYVAISDRIVKDGAPGLYAVDLASGEKKWGMPEPSPHSAAISVIPGAVFSGALNGHFRAYSTSTGEVLWDFETSRPFETVNGVQAKGGSIDAGGPVIAHGMVYTGSGYGIFGGTGGNVLLAFSVDGK
ncbi:MAG TPA: PQQ-binding-like beta-propeller repeat protein [Bryobacteraceae bacterium]|nr:PQQ-binding-like beta-propeller repeat protein [Bryobacteraceae bacterium]